jgi:Putative bacterial sensory transduction regulator
MPSAEPGAPVVRPADVEAWLADLKVEPLERADRDSVSSWDLVLDGHRRFDLPVTIILDPSLGLIVWAHYAPPINDMFRKSYRRLLRWNDEFPFAKFSIGEDERPVLAVELPLTALGADELGLALARIVGIADTLFDESTDWLWIGGKVPDQSDRRCRNEALVERFVARLPELLGPTSTPAATTHPVEVGA